MLRSQRLSGLDASMLYLETATQPLQVFSVLELDPATIPGGYSYDRFRDSSRRGFGRFRRSGRNCPTISSTSIIPSGWRTATSTSTAMCIGSVFGHPAAGRNSARSADIWPLCRSIIADRCGRCGSSRASAARTTADGWPSYSRSTTAAADGVTYANLLSQLCSTEPDPPPPDPVEATAAPTPLRMAIGGLARFASRPLQLAINVLPATIRAVVDTIRRAARGRAMAAPFTAPRTRLNARLTAHRNVAFARLELDDVKKVKNHFGVRVNDVAMALVSGVVRQFLLDRGELPGSSLVALAPVSVHEPSEGLGRNQVSGMFVRLQTQIADPVERLRALAEATTNAKEHASAIDATLLQDFSQIAGPVVLGVAKRVYARLTQFRPMYNLVVSNVPGPQTHYFLGAEVLAIYPFGPVLHGSGLNITMWSVNGKLHVSLISCPELLPDLWDMADGFAVGLKELLAEVG